jgi:hypothetical protein
MTSRILVVAALVASLGMARSWAAPDQPLASEPGAAANAAAPGAGSEPLPEVTVRASRSELLPKLSSFAHGITEPVNGEALARWQSPVCPLVAGLAQQEGEYILGRVSEVARAAGVPLGGEHCTPNLYIMVTTEPKQLLVALDKKRRELAFGNASPTTVDAFIARPQAVKVWYNTQRTQPGGAAASRGTPPAALIEGGGIAGVPVFAGSWLNNSHLQAPSEFVFSFVFVVADLKQLLSLSRGQFADYVSMVSLVQLKSPPQLGDAPTILKLFDGSPAAVQPGLSSWDEAFLKALYETDPSTKTQMNQLGLHMMREVAP